MYALIQRNSDFHASHGRYPGTWIGFNDKASEGTWVWSDGSPTDYVNFQSGEPNSGAAENCVFFYSGHGDEWADVACSQEQGFVCKQAGSGDSGVCEYAQCSHTSDCEAVPGCDQPDLVTCHEGRCYTGTRNAACAGQSNGFDLGDGGWCWAGRRDEGCCAANPTPKPTPTLRAKKNE